MNAARTHHSRIIQYSATNLNFDGLTSLQREIVQRLERRKNGMVIKELRSWFYATDSDFIDKAITELIIQEKMSIRRNGLSGLAGYRCYAM